jgi:signal transduction histidine kinase
MADSALVDRLAAHRSLTGVPREQLQWLADRGELVRFATGEVIFRTNDMPTRLFVLLTGHLSITVNRGTGPKKIAEWRAGDVTGLLPFSRMTGSPGQVITEEPMEVFSLHCDHFPAMIRECYDLTAVLVHVMVDRARMFRASELHDEKMLSLGKLSAGLAHELNNPASAVVRSSKSLTSCLSALDAASFALGTADLSPSQMAVIARLRDAGPSQAGVTASPVELIEREEAIRDWLDSHRLDPEQAETLAEAAMDISALDELAGAINAPTLPAALSYLAMAWSVHKLTYEIETAAGRIHALVSAVKGFTYMDQATMPKPVDVGRGLADTLVVLRSKARSKSIELTPDIAAALPQIVGYGGELNQVWLNLIDNALDAVPQGGHVTVSAAHEHDAIVVRVVDDGPGVPESIRNQIFDPFFTTKGVGEGTGLGLDIALRLIQHQGGTIELGNRERGSEFKVTLPIGGPGPAPADGTHR